MDKKSKQELIDYNRCETIRLLRQTGREGIEGLITFLNQSDFFTAPASTRYHLAEEGGLAEHSLNVYHSLMNFFQKGYFEAVDGWKSIVICGLMHDLCKANTYKIEQRWRKNDKNEWEQYNAYTVDEELPYGHGSKSAYILDQFILLEQEEAQAIRAHMGFSDASFKGGDRTVANIFAKNELALYLSFADQVATFIKER